MEALRTRVEQVSAVAPKDKHLSSSMSLHICIQIVVIVDSVGYYAWITQIRNALEIGLSIEADIYLKKIDHCVQYMNKYKKSYM